MDLEIVKIWKRKKEHGFAISANFKICDKYYYADLADLKFYDIGNECMIFKANKKFEVKDWEELYCNRTCKAIDEDSLMACINEFCEDLKKQELV